MQNPTFLHFMGRKKYKISLFVEWWNQNKNKLATISGMSCKQLG